VQIGYARLGRPSGLGSSIDDGGSSAQAPRAQSGWLRYRRGSRASRDLSNKVYSRRDLFPKDDKSLAHTTYGRCGVHRNRTHGVVTAVPGLVPSRAPRGRRCRYDPVGAYASKCISFHFGVYISVNSSQ
jgi:hypothetical protein